MEDLDNERRTRALQLVLDDIANGVLDKGCNKEVHIEKYVQWLEQCDARLTREPAG